MKVTPVYQFFVPDILTIFLINKFATAILNNILIPTVDMPKRVANQCTLCKHNSVENPPFYSRLWTTERGVYIHHEHNNHYAIFPTA